jgi:hypothetical protein
MLTYRVFHTEVDLVACCACHCIHHHQIAVNYEIVSFIDGRMIPRTYAGKVVTGPWDGAGRKESAGAMCGGRGFVSILGSSGDMVAPIAAGV